MKFKTCPFNNCTFNMRDSIQHECCVTIGLNNDLQLSMDLEDKMEDLIRQSKCIPLKENEFTYDINYTFEEIVLNEGDDDSDVEYDFRNSNII